MYSGLIFVFLLLFFRTEVPVIRRIPWTVKAKGPSDARTAQSLSTGTSRRSPARKSQSRAGRRAPRPNSLYHLPTRCRTLFRPTPRKTTHCALHRGAGSQRAMRWVRNHLTHILLFFHRLGEQANRKWWQLKTTPAYHVRRLLLGSSVRLMSSFSSSFRWIGSNVMATATSGSTKYAWEWLLPKQRRRNIFA